MRECSERRAKHNALLGKKRDIFFSSRFFPLTRTFSLFCFSWITMLFSSVYFIVVASGIFTLVTITEAGYRDPDGFLVFSKSWEDPQWCEEFLKDDEKSEPSISYRYRAACKETVRHWQSTRTRTEQMAQEMEHLKEKISEFEKALQKDRAL